MPLPGHVFNDSVPTQRLFAPTQDAYDDRLFEGEQLRFEVRSDLLQRVESFWAGKAMGWKSWCKVFFAGSEASLWAGNGHGNGDFDTLWGIDLVTFYKANPGLPRMEHAEFTAHFNGLIRTQYNDADHYFTIKGQHVGAFDLTGYIFANATTQDITQIKPYAAYDVTDDVWAVKSVSVPEGHQWKNSDWYYFEATAQAVITADKLNEPYRTDRLKKLWEFVHTNRNKAFNIDGQGAFAPENGLEKYLDQVGDPSNPGKKLWDLLVEAKYGMQAVASTSITHAGITIKAKDSGRILLLQRSYEDKNDPARGLWEAPGGGVERHETPLEGAQREWQEETGIKWPAKAKFVSQWVAPGGKYQGFLYTVPREADIVLNPDRAHVRNPDWSRGKSREVAAWWDPKDVKDSPHTRREFRTTTDWGMIRKAVRMIIANELSPEQHAALAKVEALPTVPGHSDTVTPEATKKLFAEHNIVTHEHNPFDYDIDAGRNGEQTRDHHPNHELHTSQDYVEKSGLRKYITEGHEHMTDPDYANEDGHSDMPYHPETHTHQGKDWIGEGHHRILAARMLGNSVEAFHRDVDRENPHEDYSDINYDDKWD